MTFKVEYDSIAQTVRLRRARNVTTVDEQTAMCTRGKDPYHLIDYEYYTDEEDCPVLMPGIEYPYAYTEGYCGLVSTTAEYFTIDGHGVYHFPSLSGGGNGPAKTSRHWGYKTPFNTEDLDEIPFWNAGFSPWHS